MTQIQICSFFLHAVDNLLYPLSVVDIQSSRLISGEDRSCLAQLEICRYRIFFCSTRIFFSSAKSMSSLSFYASYCLTGKQRKNPSTWLSWPLHCPQILSPVLVASVAFLEQLLLLAC